MNTKNFMKQRMVDMTVEELENAIKIKEKEKSKFATVKLDEENEDVLLNLVDGSQLIYCWGYKYRRCCNCKRCYKEKWWAVQ